MRVLVLIIVSVFMSSGFAQADAGVAGALIGASIGATMGHNSKTKGGVIRGAAIGAAGGYVLGRAISHGHHGRHEAVVEHRESRVSSSYNDKDNAKKYREGRVSSSYNDKGNAKIERRDDYSRRCHEGQEYYDQAFRVKRHEKKVYLLEKAAWHCPQDARVHNDLGVSYYNRNYKLDRERAEDQFQMALHIHPKYEEAKQNLRRVKY